MRLEERRLAGHFSVVSGVGFVEAIASKKLNISPNGVTHFLGKTTRHGPLRELNLMLGHQLLFLFGYRFTDHIRFTRFITG